MKRFWLFLESYVFVWTNHEAVLLYDSLSGKGLTWYLQPIINQYFVNNKSEIWLWSLMIHSKGHRFNGFINS